ncbi:hypothetical protein AB0K25_30210 [Micromonospora sp. NPDC049257]|uniref:hypothetical protein n=1 Tax=Micromonospora sp. NPDC049257 TaxID=3155771 RepID=UPI00344A79A2
MSVEIPVGAHQPPGAGPAARIDGPDAGLIVRFDGPVPTHRPDRPLGAGSTDRTDEAGTGVDVLDSAGHLSCHGRTDPTMTRTATDDGARLRPVPAGAAPLFVRAGQAVYPARRLGDLVSRRPAGVTGHQWSSALRAEFDHVVCAADTGVPLFALTVGPTAPAGSAGQRTERMVSAVCAAVGLPVLRIGSPTLRAADHGRRIITYVIDARAYAAGAGGDDPDDNPVGYRDIVGRLPDGRTGAVNDLGALSRAAAVEAYVSRRLSDPIVRGLHVRWRDGTAEGWSWVEVRTGRCLVERVTVSEARWHCGVDPARLAEDLAAVAVGDRLPVGDRPAVAVTDESALLDRDELRRQICVLRDRRDELATPFAFDHLCGD